MLTPDEELFNEVLYDTEQCFYKLENVIPATSYDLKISYPATIPTDFTIEVITANLSQTRRLLNTEKSQFTVESGKTYIAVVTAHRTGVSVYLEVLQQPVVFNIVLSTLYYGLPQEVWKLVFLVLLAIIVSVVWLAPWILTYIENSTAHLRKENGESHTD
jgi:hypothetical protein